MDRKDIHLPGTVSAKRVPEMWLLSSQAKGLKIKASKGPGNRTDHSTESQYYCLAGTQELRSWPMPTTLCLPNSHVTQEPLQRPNLVTTGSMPTLGTPLALSVRKAVAIPKGRCDVICFDMEHGQLHHRRKMTPCPQPLLPAAPQTEWVGCLAFPNMYHLLLSMKIAISNPDFCKISLLSSTSTARIS